MMRRFLLTLAILLLSLGYALEIFVLDVGQGDSVLLRAATGQTVLYDAGTAGANVLQQLQALGVSSIDLVIGSHNHADHIGGMADIVTHYQPRLYMDNGVPATTQTYERMLQAVLAANTELIEPTGQRIGLGDASLQIIPPPQISSWNQNDNSIGVIVSYGDFHFSLTGDAEPRQYGWWLENFPEMFSQVTVHRAAHHGSRNGDTPEIMAILRPEAVIISAGQDNRYGHPHPEMLELYASLGAAVYQTTEHGSITINASRDGSFTISTSRDAPALPAQQAPLQPQQQQQQAQQQVQTACVDINTASLEELQRITHIGSARAAGIINLRPFNSVDGLTRVSGIAAGRLADIKSQGLACVR